MVVPANKQGVRVLLPGLLQLGVKVILEPVAPLLHVTELAKLAGVVVMDTFCGGALPDMVPGPTGLLKHWAAVSVGLK